MPTYAHSVSVACRRARHVLCAGFGAGFGVGVVASSGMTAWRARLQRSRHLSHALLWLMIAIVTVQLWGLQHEILHVQRLTSAESHAAAQASERRLAHASHVDHGVHHHCHLFEATTLAAGMAVALPHWQGVRQTHATPVRAIGISPALHNPVPFDSRAPPRSV